MMFRHLPSELQLSEVSDYTSYIFLSARLTILPSPWNVSSGCSLNRNECNRRKLNSWHIRELFSWVCSHYFNVILIPWIVLPLLIHHYSTYIPLSLPSIRFLIRTISSFLQTEALSTISKTALFTIRIMSLWLFWVSFMDRERVWFISDILSLLYHLARNKHSVCACWVNLLIITLIY